MFDLESALKNLGWTRPAPPKPVASYLPCISTGDMLYISGQLPLRDGELIATGPVPSAVSLEDAQQAAGQCVVNGLALIDQAIASDWHRFVRIVRVGVFVQCDPGYADQPKVANGASDLLFKLLGEPGRHARAAVGVNALPLNAAVEVELIAQIRS
ncbi:RidA family protein [Phycisphaerales bacterium AB-hyl4]|uniref:RidA family protein n=1 Tax=Natronomicrosphaera hydrolytica TaxID=3242702 RepID=A0ABV4U864_9BACT